MNDSDDYKNLGRAPTPAGYHMMQASPRADELIACLEGEIAKRDEELAACRIAVENCDLFRARIAELEARIVELERAEKNDAIAYKAALERQDELRAELAAIKAQYLELAALYPSSPITIAAPVSEAKAQGVVMPDQDRYFEIVSGVFGIDLGQELAMKLVLVTGTIHNEIISLNAAPVQQVSVPDGKVCVPVEVLRLYEFMAASFTPFTSQHEQIAISLRKAKAAMLAAAPAAPAADATVRQATDGGRNQSYEGLFDGETEEQRASRLAANSAKGVV